jgi:hypothetical protein
VAAQRARLAAELALRRKLRADEPQAMQQSVCLDGKSVRLALLHCLQQCMRALAKGDFALDYVNRTTK